MMVLIKSMDIFFYEKIFSPIAMHVTTVASSCFNSIISWSSEIVAQNNILFSLSDMTLCLSYRKFPGSLHWSSPMPYSAKSGK